VKIFKRIIFNCGDCPNKVNDEEEHLDFCSERLDVNCCSWTIPEGCPLKDFKGSDENA